MVDSNREFPLEKKEEELLLEWWRRARDSQHSHHDAAKIKNRFSWLIEAPSVIIPFAIGGVAISFLGSPISDGWKILIAALGIISTILTIAHLYFGFHDTAKRHATLGARYGNVRRQIEMLLKLGKTKNPDIVDDIRRVLDDLAKEPPVVSTKVFDRTVKRLADKGSSEFLEDIQQRI